MSNLIEGLLRFFLGSMLLLHLNKVRMQIEKRSEVSLKVSPSFSFTLKICLRKSSEYAIIKNMTFYHDLAIRTSPRKTQANDHKTKERTTTKTKQTIGD